MIAPNLASRPFLNTRPVWIVTGVAVLIIVVFSVLNIRLYLESDQTLAEHLALRDELQSQHAELNEEIRAHVDELGRVPWRSLQARVGGVNAILKEHGFSWLELFNEVEEVLPWNVRLLTIQPIIDEDQVTIRLRAVAQTREAMLDLLDRLIASPAFDKPIPDAESWPEKGEAVGYLFTLQVNYLPREARR